MRGMRRRQRQNCMRYSQPRWSCGFLGLIRVLSYLDTRYSQRACYDLTIQVCLPVLGWREVEVFSFVHQMKGGCRGTTSLRRRTCPTTATILTVRVQMIRRSLLLPSGICRRAPTTITASGEVDKDYLVQRLRLASIKHTVTQTLR